MEQLVKKIEELRALIKAIAPFKLAGPKAPVLPKITAPSVPSMKGAAPTKLPAPPPDSKKDPKKIAEQIKSGAIKKPTAVLKADLNGQWRIEE